MQAAFEGAVRWTIIRCKDTGLAYDPVLRTPENLQERSARSILPVQPEPNGYASYSSARCPSAMKSPLRGCLDINQFLAHTDQAFLTLTAQTPSI